MNPSFFAPLLLWSAFQPLVIDFCTLEMNPITHLELASAQFLAHLQPGINRPLEVPLQTTAKVPEHSGTSGENDVLQSGKWDVRAVS